MIHLASILVPLDGSAFAEQALPLATQLVRSWGSRLRLVSVHTPSSTWNAGIEFPVVVPDLDQQLRDREQSYLEGVAKCIADEGDLDVECTLLDGPVAEAIETFATRTRTDLIVMTGHGRGGIRRLVLGNTADRLIRRLGIPVLVVPPRTDPLAPPTRQRILVPLDGSPVADSIIEQARTMARVTRSELVLAMIMQPTPVLLPPFVWPPEGLTESPELRERAGYMYLELLKKELTGEGIAVQCRVRTARKVAREILQLARDEECGMIAMATHGAGGIDRIMLGSVTDQVLRHADIPVLVLRPAETGAPEDRSCTVRAAERIAG